MGARLSVSSINKHHARLKAVLNDAISRGELVNKNYSKFKLSFPSSNREYLNKDELTRINSLDFSHNKPLDAVRDIFMFSCYTGLRFCDAMELSLEDIMMINDEQHIRVDQIKTNERREIPLLTPAIGIINKYNSAHFRLIKHKILPSYSNQRVNIYLKVIAAQAGINKNLTHHIARHTCATTILLDNNVPIEVVSHWLGHTNIKTTQIYAKISHTKLQNQSQRLNKIINI
jgi:integrase